LGASRKISIRRIEAQNTDICTVDKEQCLRIGELFVGRVDWSTESDKWALSHSSPLVVKKAFLQDRSNSASVFYMGELDLQKSQYSDKATSLQTLTLRNVQLVEAETLNNGKKTTPYQTQLGELNVESLSIGFGAAPSLRLKGVEVISWRQALERQITPKNHWPDRIQHWFPELYKVLKGVHLDGAGATQIDLQNLKVQGSRFTWRDNTVVPPAEERLSKAKFTVDVINSETKGVSKMVFQSKLAENGAIEFESEARFFEGAPLFDVSGFVHGLNLGNMAGYSDIVFGQRITEGVVDAAFEVGASQGQAAGRSRWSVSGLNTEGTNVSMHRAFVKLADHNNRVAFNLPIGLVLSDEIGPVVMLGRAVGKTLINNARGVKTDYSKFTPRGPKVERLAPIYFAINTANPAKLDLPRLPELAKAVRKHKTKKLVFCPVASGGEWAVLYNNGVMPSSEGELTPVQKKKLISLTEQRGAALSRLITQQGIPASRVDICEPSIDLSLTGPSLATITL